MQSAKRPRLVEVAFSFQVVADLDDERKRIFVVRASTVGGELRLTFDLHGGGDVIEGLDPELLTTITAGLELVRSKVSAEDLVEEA